MTAISVTLLGTGGPLPDPHRAGPCTLVEAGDDRYLVDAGRGALMRLAATGVRVADLTALLLTHLHSDHITDLGDVITTRWITTFEPSVLRIVGPLGTAGVVDHVLRSLGPDIAYRLAHHPDMTGPPLCEVVEVEPSADGPLDITSSAGGTVAVRIAATDHRPVEPSVAYRFDHAGAAVVVAGDTLPCATLDRLCAGADALVHTVIRKDVIASIPIPRLQDTLGYHSSPEEAAMTATRAGLHTLVLTHYVPAFPPGAGDDWRAAAAAHFAGRVELGDDLHRVEIDPAPDS